MKILAIETSGKTFSLAAAFDSKILGEVFLDFDKNSISYTDRNGSNAVFKEEILPKTKPYANMMLALVNFIDNGKIPPTIMPRVKESTDAIFRVYSHMEEGYPRQYY